LSDYLLLEIKEIADRSTLNEFRDRREPVAVHLDTARLLGDERAGRTPARKS
jgi:hypothetical protein